MKSCVLYMSLVTFKRIYTSRYTKMKDSKSSHPLHHKKNDPKGRRRQNKQQRAQGVSDWRTATADSDARHKAKKSG